MILASEWDHGPKGGGSAGLHSCCHINRATASRPTSSALPRSCHHYRKGALVYSMATTWPCQGMRAPSSAPCLSNLLGPALRKHLGSLAFVKPGVTSTSLPGSRLCQAQARLTALWSPWWGVSPSPLLQVHYHWPYYGSCRASSAYKFSHQKGLILFGFLFSRMLSHYCWLF